MVGIKNYLDQLGLIYYGLIALPLVLFPVVYLPIKEEVVSGFGESSGALYYLAALLLFLVVVFARRLYRRSLSVIKLDWSLDDKLSAYRKASMTFYFLGMISCLVSVGLLMFTEHLLFVASYPVLLLVLSLYRPSIERLKRELPLSKEDLAMIDDQG